VVSTMPRPLYPWEIPGTHCTGGWVGPKAGLDVCEKSRPHRDSIPGVAISTEIPGPHLVLIFIVNITVNTKWKKVRLGTDISVNFNMFHLTCISQIHNIQITNKMHFTGYDIFKSHFSHQHILVAIVANFGVKLLQEYKGTMWLVVSSLHNN
jgi:hypothetical protein